MKIKITGKMKAIGIAMAVIFVAGTSFGGYWEQKRYIEENKNEIDAQYDQAIQAVGDFEDAVRGKIKETALPPPNKPKLEEKVISQPPPKAKDITSETKVQEKSSRGDKVKTTTEKINAVFGGKLKNKGQLYVDLGKKYKVNPMFVAAVSCHETANGTSLVIRTKNNPGGIMGSKGFRSYKTLEAGVEDMFRIFKELYIDQGLNTIEKIQLKYCPVGAANDPKGLNKHWTTGVAKFYKQIINQ